MENPKRLCRSNTNKVFGGVAGGIAEYFDIDPIIVRILFLLVTFAGGSGVLIYIILWIALPPAPIKPFTFQMGSGTEPGAASFDQTASNPEQGETPPPFVPVPEKKSNGPLIGGLVLITLGCIFLAERFIPRIDFGDLWPLIIVVIGVVLIATSFSERNKGNTPS